MRTFLLGLFLFPVLAALAGFLPLASAAEETRAQVHHDLDVVLQPAEHSIEVGDRISFPQGVEGLARGPKGGLRFLLHAGLEVASDTPDIVVEALPDEGAEGGSRRGLRLRAYEVRPVDGAEMPSVLHLSYRGRIHHPPRSEGEEYARSFARTPGTIGEEGVVLTRATWWIPYFGEDLLDFDLTVDLPEGWDAVSQGRRTTHEAAEGRFHVGWACPHPMEEVYLIANRYTSYERKTGDVTAYAFLLRPDPTLAGKYLEATAQYLDMYSRLIGPYAFSKFALVENFWETGYGMPSFTLLGPTVIRMPFILHSSYPHEILHNWWGNSVYVDWQTGNWCEGITVYLADHLISEGRGRGVQYRFEALKKYRNYVRGTRDFPLTAFRSRHSGATEAVGYGKAMMLFHMLRCRLGDEVFARCARRFYEKHVWTKASYADIAAVFSQVAGEDLGPLFHQWVERTGAPVLALTAEHAPGNELVVEVRQTQEEAPYRLQVPLAITLKGERDAFLVPLEIEERVHRVAIPLPGEPVRVDLDPQFDVFRRLDLAETPPTLSELFGAEKVTLIVPAEGKDPLAGAWRAFAESWRRGGGGQVEIVDEDTLLDLPPDRAVWVLGSRNVWQRELTAGLDALGAGVDETQIEFGETRTPRSGHTFVFAVRHPGNPELALGWVGTDVEAALPGLARKLPHYGRYSYLAFAGTGPDNVAKGQWPASASPLVVVIEGTEDGSTPARGALPAREPLARLAPVFETARLMTHVDFLASERLRGRGVGDPMLDVAAEYVARAFAKAGFEPGGDDGSYFQTFTEADGPDGKPVTLRNVVGVLPGTRKEWAKQSVVVGAHYDHLGLGWPDVRSGNEGKVHNGADDNASGVAVLLELARVLGAELKPERSVVFVAFSGEEWGRKGSKHYVEAMKRWPAREAIAMVNLDTVGRLGGKKLLVLGAGTAQEWRHIAMGVGYTTGVESNCVPEDPEGSDQVSFQDVGVPAVQLFTGAHADYHRPTDDVDKIDAEGLAKVAVFTREVLVYLCGRTDPLTSTLSDVPPAPVRTAPPEARRVSLGTVPAFDHTGAGIRVSSVLEDSAAEAAGIRAGDLLLAIDDEALESLRHFSDVLRKYAPGDVIRIRLRRGEEEQEVEARLTAR